MKRRFTLREAMENAAAFDDIRLGSYEFYRKEAHARGCIVIGGRTLAVEKTGRSWTLDAEEFAAGIETERGNAPCRAWMMIARREGLTRAARREPHGADAA